MQGNGEIVANAIGEEFEWLEEVKETVSNASQGLS